MPWPSSWKSCTTSMCFKRLGLLFVGGGKLHISAVAGYLRLPAESVKPWSFSVANREHDGVISYRLNGEVCEVVKLSITRMEIHVQIAKKVVGLVI